MGIRKKRHKSNIPWLEVQQAYFHGITPQGIAEQYKEYGLSEKAISDKANKEGWVKEKENIKAKISENVRAGITDKVERLTNKALEALEEVIDSPECSNKDKVSAARAILDISGLKTSKQEISGTNLIQKVFITPQEVKETNKHIDDVLNE